MNRADLAQDVTDKPIALMESAGQNWKRPWVGDGFAKNAVTGKSYRGINIWLTGMAGFQSQFWGTYAQWTSLKAQVRKGEKATKIVFWKPVAYRDEESDEAKSGLIAREYSVFNADQCDNVPALKHEQRTEIEKHQHAEDILELLGSKVVWGGDRAYYSPGHDFIQMPKPEQFETQAGLYGVRFHEETHRTGHASRLDRNLTGRFGSEAYAFEELIAELGSAILCGMTGIEAEPRRDHAQYLNSWIKVLKGDKRAIFTAFSHAQKAVDFIVPEPKPEPSPEPARPGAAARAVAPGAAVPS